MNNGLIFNPQRLRFARARRMMTIKSLAEAVEMTTRMISNYENGNNDVPAETLEKIANILRYPTEFFFGEQIEELDAEWVSFRSMKGMKAAQRDAALSAGGIAVLFSDWIEKQFSLPETFLIDLREFEPRLYVTASLTIQDVHDLK